MVTATDVESPRQPPRPLLVDVKEAAHLCGLGVRTLWRLVSEGTAPGPVRLPGRRITRWRVADLEQWVASLEA